MPCPHSCIIIFLINLVLPTPNCLKSLLSGQSLRPTSQEKLCVSFSLLLPIPIASISPLFILLTHRKLASLHGPFLRELPCPVSVIQDSSDMFYFADHQLFLEMSILLASIILHLWTFTVTAYVFPPPTSLLPPKTVSILQSSDFSFTHLYLCSGFIHSNSSIYYSYPENSKTSVPGSDTCCVPPHHSSFLASSTCFHSSHLKSNSLEEILPLKLLIHFLLLFFSLKCFIHSPSFPFPQMKA